VLDPHTGQPAGGLLSASVAGPSLALADALATGLFAGGEEVLDTVAALDGYDGLVMREDGKVLAS
jgi:thiamine biosynthesis lipoprotein